MLARVTEYLFKSPGTEPHHNYFNQFLGAFRL